MNLLFFHVILRLKRSYFLYFKLFQYLIVVSRYFRRDNFYQNIFNAWFTGRHPPTLCERSEAKCFQKSSL